MRDQDKTREQLIDEIVELRQQLSAFGSSFREPGAAGDEQHIKHDRSEGNVQEQVQEPSPRHEYSKKDSGFIDTVFNNIGALIIVLDREGRIICFNLACQAATGYSFQDVAGKSITEIMTDDAASTRARLEDKLRSHNPSAHESAWISKSGERRLIAWSNTAIFDNNGEVDYIIATGSDITERKQAEKTLYESEEKLRMILDYSPHCIVLTDLSGVIIDCSQTSLDVTGFTKEEMIGMSAYELIVPRDRAMAAKNMKEIVAQDTIRAYEFTHVNKEGREYEFELTADLIKDRNGRPVAVIAVLKDITDRKQAERELALRALLLDNANDSIILHDFQGRLYYVNEVACKLHGCTREEMLQKNLFSLCIPEPEDHNQKQVEELDEQDCCAFEVTTFRKDGTQFPIEVNTRMIRVGDRQMGLSVARDITDRKKTEKVLQWERDFSNAVLDTVGALVFVVDRAGQIIRFNRACESVSGYAFQEVQCKVFWEFLLLPEEAEKAKITFKRLHVGFPIGNENCWITKQGEYRLISWRYTVLLNEASVVEYVIAAGLDITEQRQIQSALQQSEERFRALFENAPMGIAICRHNGQVLLANQACLSMFGKDFKDFSEAYNGNCIEYIAPSFREEILEIIARHERGESMPRLYETVGLKKDGSQFPIYVEISNISLRDIVLAVVFINDISEIKRTEEMLRLSYTKLESTLEQVVKSLSHMAEMRDPYTAGHQVRVANLACAIASELGMSGEQLQAIRTTALIHDIGKTAVPSEILSKPGMLSDLERSFVKAHAQASYDIVNSIEFKWPVAEIILQHHERLNGSGYPRGLSGDSILKEAKIIAIADVVEAMASHRPYRPAMPIDKALDEIRQNRGILYDPEAVDACLKLFVEKHFALRD